MKKKKSKKVPLYFSVFVTVVSVCVTLLSKIINRKNIVLAIKQDDKLKLCELPKKDLRLFK